MKYSRVARECRQNRGTRGTLRISPLYERGRKMTHSRCIAPEFSALIKCESKTQISPLDSQYAVRFEYVRRYQWNDKFSWFLLSN